MKTAMKSATSGMCTDLSAAVRMILQVTLHSVPDVRRQRCPSPSRAAAERSENLETSKTGFNRSVRDLCYTQLTRHESGGRWHLGVGLGQVYQNPVRLLQKHLVR